MSSATAVSVRRRIQLALGAYANGVFLVLWLGFAATLVGAHRLPDDAWHWLTALPPVGQVVVWILLLPITVGLWAHQANLGDLAGLLIGAGLVVWTGLAVRGLIR
jgi:hypothetical protein